MESQIDLFRYFDQPEHSSSNSSVTSLIGKAKNKIDMNYVKGLFDTDGSYSERLQKGRWESRSLTISQKNFDLLSQVKQVSESNGIKTGKIYEYKKCSVLQFSSKKDNVRRFFDFNYDYTSKEYSAGVIDGDGYFSFHKRSNANTYAYNFGLHGKKKRKEKLAFYNVQQHILNNLNIELNYTHDIDGFFRFSVSNQYDTWRIADYFKDICIIKKDKISKILNQIIYLNCLQCTMPLNGKNGGNMFCSELCRHRYRRKENPEYYKEYHRLYKIRNKDKIRQYYQDNKDRIKIKNKNYYKKNKDKILKQHRKYDGQTNLE